MNPRVNLSLIWWAFMVTNMIYLLVMRLLSGSAPLPHSNPDLFFLALLLASAAYLAVAGFFRRSLRKRSLLDHDQDRREQTNRLSFLITLAFGEAVVINGLVFFFRTRDWKRSLVLFGLGLFTQLYFRPSVFMKASPTTIDPA
jgi:hypothetical protein